MAKEFHSNHEEKDRRRAQVFQVLVKESDRGLLLVSVSYLEEALEDLLRAVFSMKSVTAKSVIEPLFGPLGPLATFSAKTRIAYAFGVIRERDYLDLEVLRRLRNQFAHRIEAAGFDSPEVLRLANQLRVADRATEGLIPEEARGWDEAQTARFRVTASVAYYAGLLHARAELITPRRSENRGSK
jgi:DNA-binding MltR family transcriptional regulator